MCHVDRLVWLELITGVLSHVLCSGCVYTCVYYRDDIQTYRMPVWLDSVQTQ